MHSCDNPPCCNPAHLSAGTNQQNLADAAAKGRLSGRRVLRGEENPAALLTPTDVVEIRTMLAARISKTEIGRRKGVSRHTIRFIESGRLWGWVKAA